MAWGKVDDGLHKSVKWRRATKGARALWTTSLSWCMDELTDGFVPKDMLRVLDGTPKEATNLVAVGLWDERKHGWKFHDWHEYQPDAGSIKAKKASQSVGAQLGNHRRWHAGKSVVVPGCEYCDGMPPETDVEPPLTESEDAETESVDRSVDRRGNRIGSESPVPVPVPDTHSETHLGSNNLAHSPSERAASRFPEFWAIYPRKVGKQKALAKYLTAAKRVGEQTIIDGAVRLANDPNLPEKNFIPHPTTWLERDGWEDEPLPPRLGTTRQREQANFWQAEIAAGRAYDEARAQDQHKEITA